MCCGHHAALRPRETQGVQDTVGRKGLQRREEGTSRGLTWRFDRTSHDFGYVARYGGDLIKEFRFVNDGDEPLVIKKITKACSCLTVSFSRRPVLPGEASVIKIKYEPHKIERRGIFHRVIQIYSNSPEGCACLPYRATPSTTTPRASGIDARAEDLTNVKSPLLPRCGLFVMQCGRGKRGL